MKINHIGYLTSDLQKAVQEFQKIGYQQISEITHDELRLTDICFMQMDGYTIELVAPYDKNSVVAGLLKRYKNTPYHICYESVQFHKDLEDLEANGYTRMGDPAPAPAFDGRNVCFLMNIKAGMIEVLDGKLSENRARTRDD